MGKTNQTSIVKIITFFLVLTICFSIFLGFNLKRYIDKNEVLTERLNSSTTIKKQTDGVMEGVFSADVMNINPQYAGVPMSVYASISIVDDKVEMKGIGVAGLDMTLKYSEEDKNLYLYQDQQIDKNNYLKPDYEKGTYSINNMVFTKVDNLNLHGFYKDLDPNAGSPYFYFSNDYFTILKDDHSNHSNHQSENLLNDYGLLTSSNYVNGTDSIPSVFKLTLKNDNTYLVTQVNDKTAKFEGADEVYFKINKKTNNVEMWVISGDNKILASSMRKSSIYEYDSYLNDCKAKSAQSQLESAKLMFDLEKSKLETQLEAATTKLEAKTVEYNQACQDLQTAQANIENLESQIQTLTTEKANLQTQLSNKIDEYNQVCEDLETANGNVAELQNKKTELEEQIQDLERQLTNKTTEYNSKVSELETAQATIQSLTNAKTELENQVETLTTEKTTLETTISTKNARITELEEQIKALQARIAELEKGTEEPKTLAAGLYEAGTTTLVKTWDELLAYEGTGLSGDLVLAADTEQNIASVLNKAKNIQYLDMSTFGDGFDISSFSGSVGGDGFVNLKRVNLGEFKIASEASGMILIDFNNSSASALYVIRYVYSGTMEEWRALMNSANVYFSETPYRTLMYVECSDGIVNPANNWGEITEEEIAANLQ